MSTPINHHYVSQCHSRQFFNAREKKIYVYDKIEDNFYPKKTTKSLFSEDYSNSKIIDGKVNHTRMETELKVMIEDEFATHLKVVKSFLSDIDKADQEKTEKAYWSLNHIVLLGIIGEYRNPIYKSAIDNTLNQMEQDVIMHVKNAYGIETQGIFPKKEQATKYENRSDYLSIAMKIFEKLDPISFSVYVIDSGDHFLLPDTSCFQIRANGRIGEIMQIGIPLTDKIFVLATSGKVNKEKSQIITLGAENFEHVLRINCDLANFAYKGIACSDMNFLKRIIDRIKRGE